MVSNKDLEDYEFSTIEKYFNYIIESKINGQHAQVLDLIKSMSKSQKKHCLIYFDEQTVSEHVNYCKSILIKEL